MSADAIAVEALDLHHAEPLRAFFARVPDGDRRFFREDVVAAGVVEEWLQDPCEHRFVAVDGSDVVGSLGIRRGVGWSAHVGEIRIVVDPGRRRQGIGRLLARHALVAGLDLDLAKLVVEVAATHESTIAMFNALGFIPEALLTAHIRDSTGELHDLLVMSHFADATWSAMQATGIADLIEG